MKSSSSEDKFFKARQDMVAQQLKGRDITDKMVTEAMSRVRREEFVPEKYKSSAYFDGPLPIGCGQTISQPYIVALMTQELQVGKNDEVLEIGTGCGYQTAVLSCLAKKVYTIEKISPLSELAQANLANESFSNIEFFVGDGSCGWPEKKQFDRIIITAAVPSMPKPLTEQLKDGGIIVGPVGSESFQDLVICEKKAGKISEQVSCGCRFVRLIGEYGFSD